LSQEKSNKQVKDFMRVRLSAGDKLLKMSMGDVQAYGAGPAKKNFVENIEEMEPILAAMRRLFCLRRASSIRIFGSGGRIAAPPAHL
jgi:hypothetical protein